MSNLDKNFLLPLIEEQQGPSGEYYSSLSLKATHTAALQGNFSLKEIEILALQNQIIPERHKRNKILFFDLKDLIITIVEFS